MIIIAWVLLIMLKLAVVVTTPWWLVITFPFLISFAVFVFFFVWHLVEDILELM